MHDERKGSENTTVFKIICCEFYIVVPPHHIMQDLFKATVFLGFFSFHLQKYYLTIS